MDRPLLRQIAVEAGYSVHKRSSHSVRQAWDWSPKDPMQSSHFTSEEAAWRDVEHHMRRELEKAEKLIRIASALTTVR